MKLKPLSCERYTIRELLEYLEGEDYQWDEIRNHAEHGNIQMQGRVEESGPWVDVPPNDFDDDDFLTFTCTREEAERFKKEYCQGLSVVKDEPLVEKSTETAEQLCERLELEGLSDKDIAKELRRVFPEILPSKIGRLLPANPGAHITGDGHRKRGERLLRKG